LKMLLGQCSKNYKYRMQIESLYWESFRLKICLHKTPLIDPRSEITCTTELRQENTDSLIAQTTQ
jgi:hypothetical protein